jgi:hypothetical protein
MIQLEIDADDLLKWARFMEEVPKKTPAAIARALNTVGDNVLRVSTDYLAESTGLDTVDIMPLITVKEATPQDLSWSMDARAITLQPSPNWERPWESPGDQTFQSQQLLQIVTSGDDNVCPVCAQAALDSPYTAEDISALAARWKDYEPSTPSLGELTNLLHPRCRCVTMPWQSSRQLNVNFAATPPMAPVTMTAKDIGEALATELGGVLKVT